MHRFVGVASLLALVAGVAWAAPSRDPDLDAAAGLAATGAWAQAESLAVGVLTRAGRVAPPDTASMEQALAILSDGRLKHRIASDSLGIAWAARLLELRRSRTPVDSSALADAESMLGQLYALSERFPEALAHLGEALALRRAGGSDSDSLVAAGRLVVGTVQRRAKLLPEARRTLTDALAAYAPGRGDGDLMVAQIRIELAGTLSWLDERDEARREYESALACYRTRFGEGPQLGVIYDGLSQVEKNAGNMAQSLEWLERSVDVKTRGYGRDALSTLITRANMGGRLIEFGDPASARRWLEPLVAPFESLKGRGHSITEQVRTQLGIACLYEGDAASARPILESSLAALQERPGDHRAELAWTLRWLARAACVEGDLQGARRFDEQALEIARDLEDSESSMLLEIRTERLAILGALGDTAALSEAVESTRTLLARWDLEDSQFAASTRAELARALTRLGRRDAAWTEALASDGISHRLLLANADQLSERNAFALSGQWSESLPILARLALGGAPADPALAWDRAQKWRGWWDRERELRLPPRGTKDADVARAHEAWAAAERAYSRAIVDRARGGDAGDDALSEARTRAERAEADYRQRARRNGVLMPEAEPDLAGILGRLGPDDVLLSFGIATAAPADPEEIVAFLSRGGGAVSLVDLGPGVAARAALDAWRRTLATPPGARAAEAEADCRRAGAAVRGMLWDPLGRWIDGATTVHVVDGALEDVPWLALPVGTSRYLAEQGPEIRVHEAERDLLRSDPPVVDTRILAIGNPDFDRSASSVLARADVPEGTMFRGGISPCTSFPHLAALPAAGREAADVARTVSRHPIVRTGAGADEARFKREAPGCTILHLATHGVVLSDTCGVAGSPGIRGVGGVDPVPSPAEAARSRWARLPFEGSGSPWLGRRVWLAFAGANHAADAVDENDGMLTAEEVVTLDLRQAEWVVLSACHSGSLEAWSREGALGMIRALHQAGARTVIASRWSLEDESAREWMRALYRERARGVRGGNAALEGACRIVLADRRGSGRTTHPFYWSSFAASGD